MYGREIIFLNKIDGKTSNIKRSTSNEKVFFMKNIKTIIILFNLVCLLGYINWSIFHKEKTISEGTLMLFELRVFHLGFRALGRRNIGLRLFEHGGAVNLELVDALR